jgi:DNA-binding LytR/AlgR family response regulator
MLRVLVVDDELPALEELTYLLHRDPRIAHVSAVSDASAALRELGHSQHSGARLDAVFLDIRMPGLDGLDLARLIAGFSDPPQVVFVTAYDDFAVQAFDLRAVDYLLKPVRQGRLTDTVDRLVARRAAPAAERPAVQEPGESGDESIPVDLGGRTRFVPRSKIQYAEAQGDYVRLHTDGESYLVRMSLATLARRWLDAGFIRIHRSILVSGRHVHELRIEGSRTVVDIGGSTLPVSRRHAREVRDQLVRPFYRGGAQPDDPADDSWERDTRP